MFVAPLHANTARDVPPIFGMTASVDDVGVRTMIEIKRVDIAREKVLMNPSAANA